jgi:predicted tellurium resistance membrane protein TerC
MLRNKRGLTPIAATTLLIVFALALGVVILNFGESLIEQSVHEAPVVEGRTLCPIGCVAEDLFSDQSQVVVKSKT